MSHSTTYKSRIIIFIIFAFILLYSINYQSPLSYYKHSLNKIRVAFYCTSLKYGGVERVTSILLNYLVKEKYLALYLITFKPILFDEYSLPNNITRISLNNRKRNLFKEIKKEEIDILIYNFYEINEIKKLNKLKKTKVIYYNHSSYFLWILNHVYNFKQSVYQEYKNCKYILSLIPLETDYLFKIWGINSVFVNNPSTYDYDSVLPSNLSQKNIIMVGRGNDPSKRFELGIFAMKTIIKEIPDCKMNIISKNFSNLINMVQILNLNEYIKITGYQKNPESYYKNASLHIFPSICDTYPMVISETKIFGIPTIICGLDYLALAQEGTVIIHDNEPNSLAREAIKILKNDMYRKKLGIEARESMKKIKNDLIAKKWAKLLLSVYKGVDELSFQKLFNDNHKRINQDEADMILNNQLKIFKKVIPNLKGATIENLKSFSFE